MSKKTVVIGASTNTERYAYKAVVSLQKNKHEVIPVGLRDGEINGTKIRTDKPFIENVDTITLYVGQQNQAAWQDYIFSLHPKRIVFNPGTENSAFEQLAQSKGIETIEACTLVMLSIGNY